MSIAFLIMFVCTYADTRVCVCVCDNRVLDSIKSGRRLPESNFSSVKLVESSQRSLNGMLTKAPDSSEKGEFSVERKEEEEW